MKCLLHNIADSVSVTFDIFLCTIDKPAIIHLNGGAPLAFYMSASPPEFCAPKRTSDIDSIVDTMQKAKSFVYIAVMDYIPAIVFDGPRR